MGREKSGLHKLAAKGSIPRCADGKFDLEAVRSAIAANTEPSRQAKPFNPVHGSGNGERTVHFGEAAKAVVTQATAEAHLATTRVREILFAEGIDVGDQPLSFNDARTAEMIVKVWQRDHLHADVKGRLIDAEETGRRWADEIVKLRAARPVDY